MKHYKKKYQTLKKKFMWDKFDNFEDKKVDKKINLNLKIFIPKIY